jgi:hypothetical protein
LFKVLASINKSKIELATQPLPNAKKLLFGGDFPSIASKEAELSRGLAKNLAPVAGLKISSLFKQSQCLSKKRKVSKFLPKTKMFSSPLVSAVTAAKLPQFIEQWKNITSDPAVLEIVTRINIPFRCVPFKRLHK